MNLPRIELSPNGKYIRVNIDGVRNDRRLSPADRAVWFRLSRQYQQLYFNLWNIDKVIALEAFYYMDANV